MPTLYSRNVANAIESPVLLALIICRQVTPSTHQTTRAIVNILSLAGGNVVGNLIALVTIALIAHSFGDDGFGLYTVAMVISGLLAQFADFGLGSLSITELSRLGTVNGKQLGTFLVARFLTTLVVLIGLALIIALLIRDDEFRVILALIGSSLLIWQLGSGFIAAMNAIHRMEIGAILDVVTKAIVASATYAIVSTGGDLIAVAAVFPITSACYTIVAWRMSVRIYGPIIWAVNASEVRTVIRQSVPFAFAEILRQTSTRIDVIAVSVFLGVAAAGIYNAAYRVLFALNFLPALAAKAMLPILSSHASASTEESGAIMERYLAALLLLFVPASVGLFLVSPQVVNLLFGPDFDGSVIVLRILSGLLLAATFSQFFATYMMAARRQPESTRLQFYSTQIGIVASISFVPLFGVKGAAAAALLAHCSFVAMLAKRIRSLIRWRAILGRLAIAAAGSVCMILVWWPLSDVHLILIIPLLATVYFTVVLMFKSVRENEAVRARALLRGLML